METLFVRHAVAEELEQPGGDDARRRLTKAGRKEFKKLAKRIVKNGWRPDRILHSPLVRTTETAEILREAAGLDAAECQPAEFLAPGIAPQALWTALNAAPELRTALVGHEPDMSRITAQAIGGGKIAFAKGGIACVEFAAACAANGGRLQWYVSPQFWG